MLQNWLVENIDCPGSNNLDEKSSCLIIDEQVLFFLLVRQRTMRTLEIAFTLIASALYQGILYESIDIVFDRYFEESIN